MASKGVARVLLPRAAYFVLASLILGLVPSSPLAGEIHDAAINGNAPMVQELLDQGVDPDVIAERQQWKGGTALHIAAYFGHARVARTLVDHGADPTLTAPPVARTSLP